MERLNIEALATLTTRDNAQLRTFPADLVAAARSTASDVLGELAGKGDKARKVHDSYTAFRDKISAWSRISIAGGAGSAGRVKGSVPNGSRKKRLT